MRRSTPSGGTRDAVSRYSKLKAQLDQDLFAHGKWVEIDTTALPDDPCTLTMLTYSQVRGAFPWARAQLDCGKL